jgi:hypothetical protein
MKYSKILSILLLSTVISIYSCNDKPSAAKQQARESLEAANPPSVPNAVDPPSAQPAEPAQNAAGVWHYTCSKGCAGGAGAKGNCATCGGPLAHNPAYHPQNTTTPTTPPITPQATPPTAEPAQNAAGVWHYTCANGCAGGAGAAGPCATCGSTLAHNTVYHQ